MIGGKVGEDTFGFERYLNQIFYKKPEWLSTRDKIIARDFGCDLGIQDREIAGRIIVHHINPITPDDIRYRSAKLFDPENLICTVKKTHDAIHYGDESILFFSKVAVRTPNECPWRKG